MIRGWIELISAVSRRLAGSTRGAVALIGALSLTTIVGMGAFAVEATQGYAADANNQRVADMAALAGALAYNVGSSTSAMTATAKAVVAAQGIPATAADVQLVTDAATSKQLVQVTVTTAVPLALGRVFTSALSYDVSAVGSATTTTTTAPPCIAALSNSPTYGVTLSGGVSISAPGCAIDTNAGVTVPWGTHITAKQVNAGKTVNNPGSGITTSPTANNIVQNKSGAATDWAKDDANLKLALCKVNKLSGYSDPDYADNNTVCTTPLVTINSVAGAGDLPLDYSPGAGLSAYWNSSSKTYDIPASYITSIYDNKIANLNVSGGITAYIRGPLTLDIGNVSMGGTALHFGSGNISIGTISTNGGSVVDFDVGVGNTITMGTGFGTTAINLGNGSKFCFTLATPTGCSAPTAAAGVFSINGNIVTGGGSAMSFPKAATHVVNGNISSSGAMTFGSGTYYINGNFTNSTGGAMTGVDVTFALSGTIALAGGTSLDLSAPTPFSSYGVPTVLIATKTSSATTIGGGATGKYSGLIYAPKSALNVSGGATLSSNGGACLMLIVSTFSLSGGTSVGSCSGAAGSSSSTASVALFK